MAVLKSEVLLSQVFMKDRPAAMGWLKNSQFGRGALDFVMLVVKE